MTASEEFFAILTTYREDLDALDKSLRPGDGVFGFGRVPGNDPCHERFDAKTAALVESRTDPDSDRGEAAELIQTILHCEGETMLPVYAQGMLIAIQRHVLPLIDRLTKDEAGELRRWYEKQYPFFRRAPIQKDILNALKRVEAVA